MSTQTGTGIDTRLFIGGAFVEAEDGRTFENRDPWSGDVVSDVASASGADAKRAVEAAAEAFPEWSRTPPAVRQGIFLKAADVLESRQDEVVSMLARETGCTFGFGMFQMHFVPGLFRQAAALAYAPLGEVIPSDTGAFAMGIRRPVGVVGAIAPWNAALILSARSIAAPLVLGNTVVLKPSEWSPQVGGLLWGEVFAEAGLPPGVLNVVTHGPGEAQAIGDELIESPARAPAELHGLDGYGPQARRGRRAAAQARRARARRLQPADRPCRRRPRVCGQCDDVRCVPPPGPDLHVGTAGSSSTGRSRTSSSPASRRRRAASRPATRRSTTRSSARSSTPQPLATVQRRVDEAVSAGAKVLAGGSAEGPCFQATLLADVPADSEFANEETFGPVAAIEVVDSAEEAVARANATAYGLSSGIITSDTDRGLELAQAIDAGIVHVNDQPVGDEPQMPFGGVKDSGFGRFGGTAVVDEFTETRWITVQRGPHPFPF